MNKTLLRAGAAQADITLAPGTQIAGNIGVRQDDRGTREKP